VKRREQDAFRSEYPVASSNATKESATMGQARGPLSDIRVIELGHIVAGPSGGMILADLGADVVKVEEPRLGDQARGMPNGGAAFYAYNRNKRSLALDLKSEGGREVFRRLVGVTDVVLDNYAPGVLDRLGIGYDWAAGINPRVIYCSIKGFLPGPYGDRPSLDELAQMMGGLAYMTGPAGQPLRAGASVIDIAAATYGVVATLAALHARDQTGRGQLIRSGLFESAVFLLSQHVSQASLTGQAPVPIPARGMGSRLGWAVYRLFTTSDDRQVFIAVTSNGHWARFCAEFGLDDLGRDPALNTNAKRSANRARIIPRIEEIVRGLTAAELVERLERIQVPFAPLNTPFDVLSDEHLNEGGRLLGVRGAQGQTVRVPALPVDGAGLPMGVRRDPPALGQHTTEILTELGFADRDIAELLEAHVAAEGGPTLFALGPTDERS
jgi:crotonobetainyl-CoA:carnitine CoA-transferase CaiB-like acyl-CoA transferase